MKFSQSWKVPTWDLSMLKLATSAFTVLNEHQPTVIDVKLGHQQVRTFSAIVKLQTSQSFLSSSTQPIASPVCTSSRSSSSQQPFSTTLNNPWKGGSQAAKLGATLGQRIFLQKKEKYVKVLSIIFPNPRTGQNHTPAYNDNV